MNLLKKNLISNGDDYQILFTSNKKNRSHWIKSKEEWANYLYRGVYASNDEPTRLGDTALRFELHRDDCPDYKKRDCKRSTKYHRSEAILQEDYDKPGRAEIKEWGNKATQLFTFIKRRTG